MNAKDDDPTPRPAEVAHALLDEITSQVQTRPPSSGRALHWLLPILSALVAASALLGVLGRGFYVTREEYTASEKANAVSHTELSKTLAAVDRTLSEQTLAMKEMSKALQEQAVQLASMRRHEK